MSDSDDDTPSDRVKKAMAGKKPVKAAPFKVIDGGKQPARREGEESPEAKKPRRSNARKKADGPPPHEAPPDGPTDGDEQLPPDDFEGPPYGTSPEDIDRGRECALLDQNDRDNGRRLLIWFGPDIVYISGMGWLTWRGTHWQRDEGDLGVRLFAQNLVDKIKFEAFFIEASPAAKRLIEAAEAAGRKPDDQKTPADFKLIDRGQAARDQIRRQQGKRHTFAVQSGNAGKTEAMLKQAASLKALDATALDANHHIFNVANGTLHFIHAENPDSDPDAPTFAWRCEFRPHQRADMATKRAEVHYDPEAKCPEFDAFLGITQPDARMRLFLQVFHAYALLLGGNDEQRLVFHFGTGANGKSAFMEAIGRLAGGYRAVVSPDTITGEQQRDGSKANSDIARLHSTRFVTIEELPRGTPLKENLIKALTGGTRMVARFLQKEIFEFDPVFTAVMSGNDMPTVSGTDYGIWRRLLIVQWGVTIPEAHRIPFGQLMARFDGERAGILNWLIEGALRYLNEGLVGFIPAEVLAFTDDYREERDHIGVFVAACVKKAEGGTVSAGEMFKAYSDWCEVNGLKPWSQTAFGTRMNALGIKKERGRTIRYLDVALGDVPSKFDPPNTRS